jgi:hypothetical protein
MNYSIEKQSLYKISNHSQCITVYLLIIGGNYATTSIIAWTTISTIPATTTTAAQLHATSDLFSTTATMVTTTDAATTVEPTTTTAIPATATEPTTDATTEEESAHTLMAYPSCCCFRFSYHYRVGIKRTNPTPTPTPQATQQPTTQPPAKITLQASIQSQVQSIVQKSGTSYVGGATVTYDASASYAHVFENIQITDNNNLDVSRIKHDAFAIQKAIWQAHVSGVDALQIIFNSDDANRIATCELKRTTAAKLNWASITGDQAWSDYDTTWLAKSL